MIKTIQYLSEQQVEQGQKMTTEEVIIFLENFKQLHFDAKHPKKSKLISMKIKQPLLEAFKVKAKLEGQPYQSLIKDLMRDYLNS